MTTEEFRREQEALDKSHRASLVLYIIVCSSATAAWLYVLVKSALIQWG